MMVEEMEKAEKRMTEKIGKLRETLMQEKEQLTSTNNNEVRMFFPQTSLIGPYHYHSSASIIEIMTQDF